MFVTPDFSKFCLAFNLVSYMYDLQCNPPHHLVSSFPVQWITFQPPLALQPKPTNMHAVLYRIKTPTNHFLAFNSRKKVFIWHMPTPLGHVNLQDVAVWVCAEVTLHCAFSGVATTTIYHSGGHSNDGNTRGCKAYPAILTETCRFYQFT